MKKKIQAIWVKMKSLSRKEKIIRIVVGVVLLCIAISLGFVFWFLWPSKPKPNANAEEVTAAAASTNQESVSTTQFAEVKALIAEGNKASDKLSRLVSSNQVATERRIEAVRTETQATITNLVETAVAKAMEPFKRFLTNPPPVAVKASPALAPVVPPAVTNSNTLVVNLPSPPQPLVPQPVVGTTTATPPPVVFQNHNTMVVVGGVATTLTNTAPPPYWLMKLF